jgi:hypothetical protein
LGAVTLGANQQANLRLILATGSHLLSARYAGDPNFLAAAATILDQVVNPIAVTVTPTFTG